MESVDPKSERSEFQGACKPNMPMNERVILTGTGPNSSSSSLVARRSFNILGH